ADLETNHDLNFVDRDKPTADGQGNFREFSVTRLLWDAYDTDDDGNDNIDDKFHEIWAALTKTTDGFRDSTYAFRHIGHLHIAQGKLSASDWTNLRNMERHYPDTRDYAQYVTTGSCADQKIEPQPTDSSQNSHFQT